MTPRRVGQQGRLLVKGVRSSRQSAEAAARADRAFLPAYFRELHQLCRGGEECVAALLAVRDVFAQTVQRGKKVVLIGNGGSAAIACHVAVDLTKRVGVRAINFNEAALITCFANDYGYERWLEQAIGDYGESGDVLVAVSSSGQSKNILNACHAARTRRFASVITCSGFSPENPLRGLGDHNLWVDSRVYNLVELTHLCWLLAVVDLMLQGVKGRAQ